VTTGANISDGAIAMRIPSKGILDRLSQFAEEMDHHEAAQNLDLDVFAAEYILNWAAHTP